MNRLRTVAILRGITTDEVVPVAQALYEEGFRDIEIPLNSPDPFVSIAAVRKALPADCRVGAGTVVHAADVDRVHDAGGTLVVAPTTNPEVIRRAVELGMEPMPGAATPTEAFAAIDAGARLVKLFPGDIIGPAGLKAMRSVIPHDIGLLAVGGVSAETIPAWVKAGAAGFGIGSSLYTSGRSVDEIRALGREILDVIAQTEGER